MKKLLTSMLLVLFVALMLVPAGMAVSANPTLERSHLVGTWVWDGGDSYTIVIRNDGTMTTGTSLIPTQHNWTITDGNFMVNNVDWEIEMSNDGRSFSVFRPTLNARFSYTRVDSGNNNDNNFVDYPENDVTPDRPVTERTLEERLIGTWAWADSDTYRIIFRADGTMTTGMWPLRVNRTWTVTNNRLIVDGTDWQLQLSNDGRSFSVLRPDLGTRYTYTRFSDDYASSSAAWVFIVGGFCCLIFVGAIILIIVLVMRKKKKPNPQMTPQWSTAGSDPNNFNNNNPSA